MSDNYTALIDRLRGIYTIRVNDGAGPLNGKDTFTREFDNLPPINKHAACALEKLASHIYETKESPPELHDLAAKVLNVPSLCHGFHPAREAGS